MIASSSFSSLSLSSVSHSFYTCAWVRFGCEENQYNYVLINVHACTSVMKEVNILYMIFLYNYVPINVCLGALLECVVLALTYVNICYQYVFL